MRKRFVAGNWKMNLSAQEAEELSATLAGKDFSAETQVVLCSPSLYLSGLIQTTKGNARLAVGAQNCHQEVKGAFTGEVSAVQLKSLGVEYVILGHSERRAYFGEDNALLKTKVDAALAAGLKVIFCCGEVLEEREAGNQETVVASQLTEALAHLTEAQMADVVIAYEPVWAIGTGKTASSDQAQDMHKMIRGWMSNTFSSDVAASGLILYGGSCKPGNAKELFSQEDVDGGLIGGASLKAEDFVSIITA